MTNEEKISTIVNVISDLEVNVEQMRDALIAKDADNLLMAGRCFSAEQLALSSARVSTSCSMMGQATGIAAAMSVNNRTKIRNLDYSDIRDEVLSRGAQLDVKNQYYKVHG